MMTKKTTQHLILFVALVALLLTASAQLASPIAGGQRAPWNNGRAADGQTGKTEAVAGAQPWMVALVDSGTANAHDGQFCGGSLIDRQWVLTAAHCLEGMRASEVDLVIGRHQLSSSAGERIGAAQLIVHPQYYDDHDIALIKLSRPATQGAIIQTITSVTDHLDEAGTQGRVTGWGVLSEEGEDAPDRLHGVNVPIIAEAVCKASYQPGDIGRYELCAGTLSGADSCYGDSGGPLVVPNANATGYLQAGVVSWGDGCGTSYGVYTRVSEYEAWINHHLYGAAQPAPLPEDGGQTAGDWDSDTWADDWNDTWDSGWDSWDDDVSAETNTHFPDSLAFGLQLIDAYDDGYEAFASYENTSDWVEISSYDDGYANLNEYLNEIGAPTSGQEIIWVSGVKLYVEPLGWGNIGVTAVVDGQLIFIDSSLSLSQLRTVIASIVA